jgi:hypothetical protein
MCLSFKRDETIEEHIARLAVGMTDSQLSQLWYEIDQQAFHILGEIPVETFQITASEFNQAIVEKYPQIQGLRVSDSIYRTTSLKGLESILLRDWTKRQLFVHEEHDCDDFASDLTYHLRHYYKIQSVIEVWGYGGSSYHAFNLAVLKENQQLIVRLIEPQANFAFVENGPLGVYRPELAVIGYGSLL